MTTKEKILLAVEELKRNGNKITGAALARKLNLSEQRIHQAISRRELGLVDYKELNKKIEKLNTNELTIQEIAEKVGYRDDVANLRNLLNRRKKSFKKQSGRPQKEDIKKALDRLAREQAICMTSRQIARKFFNNNIQRTRDILYRYHVRFYKMRDYRLSEK